MLRFRRDVLRLAALAGIVSLAAAAPLPVAGSAAASSTPGPALVAAEVSPAVEMVRTDYSATVIVPSNHVTQGAFAAESAKLTAEQNDGQLGSSVQARNEQWASDLAADPSRFAHPGPPFHIEHAQVTFLCTGWFVTPTGYLISAAHCVTRDSSVTQALVSAVLPPFIAKDYRQTLRNFANGGVVMNQTIASDLHRWEVEWYAANVQVSDLTSSFHVALGVRGAHGQRGAQMMPATVVAHGSVYPGRDYALFKVNGYSNLPTLPLGSGANPQVGDNLYVDGFPGTVTGNSAFTAQSQAAPTFTSGLLSAYRTSVDHVPYLQTQAPAYHGNSGGPVLDTQGNVIGTLIAGASAGGQVVAGYQFVLPVAVIRTVLAEHGIHPAAGPVTSQYDAALADYYQGYYKRARPEFQAVLAAFPQHPYAASYIRLSQRQIAEGHDRTPSFPWLLPLIALAMLALAGGAVLWARDRQQRPPGPATDPSGQPLPWPPPAGQAPQLGDDPGWPPAH